MTKKRARQKAASNGKKPEETPASTGQNGASDLGRPSKFTLDVRERIIGAIRSGAYNETAAAYAGIGERTFYRWLAQADEDEKAGIDLEASDFRQFRQAVEKAQAEAELEHILVIRNAAKGKPTADGVPGTPGQWQAAAWMLERKHPGRYGRRLVSTAPPTPTDDDKPRKEGRTYRIAGLDLVI